MHDAAAPDAPRFTRTHLAGALLIALVWFAPLGYRDLAHPDEGRYSEISREMVATGDWVTPRLNGLKYFEKPPLQYWATAAAFELFGESEFTARLWIGLAALLSVLLVGYTGAALWGRKAGEYATLALASMTGMLALGQVVTLDMTLTLCLTLALCAFLLASNERAPERTRRRWMLVVWAGMAGAMLAKGLVGLLIPGATLVLYSLVRRDFTFWKRLEWLRGPAIFLALAAPWFVLVSLRNAEFPEFFFIHEHFERFATTGHNRAGPVYYFIPVLLLFALPWTSLLPQAVRYAAAPARTHRPENRLLLSWCGFIFAFFSLSGSKLPPYILPMLPAVALLLGQSLADAPEGLLRRHAFGVAAVWLLFALLGVALAVSAAHPAELARLLEALSVKHWTPNEYDADFAGWLVAGAGAYAVLAVVAGRASARGRKDLSIVLLAAAGIAGSELLAAGYQAYAPMRSARALAEEVAPLITPETELFTAYEYDQTLPFYLKRTLTVVGFTGELKLGEDMEPDRWIATLPRFVLRWKAAPRAIAFTTPETVQQLQGWGVPIHIVHTDKRHVVIAKP